MENPINLYEVVMARFAEKQIPQRVIARESGVPFSTVCKIAQGSVKEPSVHTVQRLFDYFQSKQPVSPIAQGTPFECASGDPRYHLPRRSPEKRQTPRRKEGA
jgi:hypothetical protein